MDLPPEAIQEYKAIWKKDFGEDISDDKARESAESFMRLVLLILRPSPDQNGPSLHSTIENAVDKYQSEEK